MKTIKTDGVNSRYLQNLGLLTSGATILAVLITVSSFLWMLLGAGNTTTNATLLKSIFLFVVLFSTVGAFFTAHRARHGQIQMDTRYQLAWLLIGLGLLSNVFGRPCATLLSSSGSSGWGLAPDLFYPLVFVGLLLLPRAGYLRISAVLDAFIIVLCILGVAWFFLTNAANLSFLSAGALDTHLLNGGMLLIYPGCDIFLGLILLQVLQRGIEPMLRTSFLLLALGLAANIWVDVASMYMQVFTSGYQPGTPFIDPFALLSLLCIGLAALYQYTAFARHAYKTRIIHTLLHTDTLPPDTLARQVDQSIHPRWWYVQSFYLPLALLLCALLFIQSFNENAANSGFMVLSAIAGTGIILRYLFSTREARTSLQEREKRYQDAEQVRYLAIQLSDIRDLEQLRERITHIMLHDFHFSFAMLMLIEEYNSPLTDQSHIQINADSVLASPMKWRLPGTNVFSRTILTGKRLVLDWTLPHGQPLSEIDVWLERQHVGQMTFFPIRYQDKVLGSLGVGRHALAPLKPPELSIVEVYAEQISAVIEHAYLYREASAREAFARAMTNISTRLNAVVVGPTEISQQICKEAAQALRADYAILYIAHEDGLLVPLAVSQGDDPTATNPAEWPTFPLAEYEAEALHPRHPSLLDITQRRKMPDPTYDTGALVMVPQGLGSRRALALRTKLARHHIQTSILAPLVSGGRIMGLLIFARVMPAHINSKPCYDATDLPHAQSFVEQASVAFTNARLYQHLRTTHERLQELDQLKDQFMVTASHELRTPLTAVQGYIELIAQYDDTLPPEQRREFLQKAQLGCEELAVLLRNVMDASRLEVEAGIRSALISRVSVAGLIDKVKLMIDPQMTQQKRELEVTIPPQLYVMADPIRLHQVLMNVSTNALKYSPEATPITFSARVLQEQQPPQVIISIADKGKGVAPHDQPRLFQRFYRLESDLNSPVRGSGLGLYISRRLIEAMGGKIWIESSGVPGEGSTFHIQLPMG